MKFRKSKLLLKVAILVVLLLLLKWTFSVIFKFSWKPEEIKTFIDEAQMTIKPTPSELLGILDRSSIAEKDTWASYQRDIILKQDEDRQRFEKNGEENDGFYELNETLSTQRSKFQASESFTDDKKEDNEFQSGATENDLEDREITEDEVSTESVEVGNEEATENARREITDSFIDEYQQVHQQFADGVQQKEEIEEEEEDDEDGSKEQSDEEEKIDEEQTENAERIETQIIAEEEIEQQINEREGKEKDEEEIDREGEMEISKAIKHRDETIQGSGIFKTPSSSIATKSKPNASTKQQLSIKTRRKAQFSHIKKKLVLLYTSLFDRMPWPDLEYSDNFTQFRGQPCAVRNCEITYNKSRILESDAVLFHCRDLPSAEAMEKIPRLEKQRWVFFTHENPVFTYKYLTQYNHFFNWTMSYRSDSDFFVPYNYYSRLKYDRSRPKKMRKNYPMKSKKVIIKNHAKEKDKLVAWMVGNCGQLRDEIVSKLTKYINVTIFGACAKKFNQSGNHCARGSQDCSKLLRRFKFYLAFENEMCLDYVTEKYWYTPFEHDMVPVVLGSNYDSNVAIPGSFINVLDFPSIESLARYLQYLDRNDTAYNEYFMWKTKYKVDYPLSVVWTCNLCAALNNASMPKKVYHDLDMFWGVKSTCRRNEEKINTLLKDDKESVVNTRPSEQERIVKIWE